MNFDLLEEKKNVQCRKSDEGSKDELTVECSTIYIQEKQIYLLRFYNLQDLSVRLHVKLKYPEAQFIFLGFERVENNGVLATEIIGPKQDTYLMLKNLSHYETISIQLEEDFEIEIDQISYQVVKPSENKPEHNFLQLILDLISSSQLYPEKTILETLSPEQAEELLTSEGLDNIPHQATQFVLNYSKNILKELNERVSKDGLETKDVNSATSILIDRCVVIDNVIDFKRLYSLSPNTEFRHTFFDLITIIQMLSKRFKDAKVGKMVEDLERKIRKFFVSSSIGS